MSIIEVTESVRRKRQVAVDFPIYRKHVLDTCAIYMRVEQTGDKLREITLTVHDAPYDRPGTQEVEVEIDNQYRFDGSEMDYTLGRGIYACTAEEYNRALEKVRAVLRQVDQ